MSAILHGRNRGPTGGRIELLNRGPLRRPIVARYLRTRDGTAIQLSVIDDQGIDFGAIRSHPAEYLPILAAQVSRHFGFRPGPCRQLALINGERVRLQGALWRGWDAGVGPIFAVKREG